MHYIIAYECNNILGQVVLDSIPCGMPNRIHDLDMYDKDKDKMAIK